MPDYIVQVNHLTKKFGQFKAVDNISFSIKTGEIVGLLGVNGAGKTTTIQMLLGLITPTSGSIHIFGKDLKINREEILTQANFSSTYTHLPWHLTVWENLYVTALLYSVKKPKERIDEVIKIMNLEEFKDTTVAQLSSGWITRLTIARSFVNNPKLLLLDEPTASLDPEGADSVRNEILKLNKEKTTILWTSHNMAEVEEVCGRVIFLHKGKILAIDTPRGLAKTIKLCHVSLMVESNYLKLQTLIKQNNWKEEITDNFVTIELEEESLPKLLNLLTKENILYSEISIEKPTLEDFFISTARKT